MQKVAEIKNIPYFLPVVYIPSTTHNKDQKGTTKCRHVHRYCHWKAKVVMKPTLSSLVAPDVVVTTTSGTTIDDKVGTMATLNSSMTIRYIAPKSQPPNWPVRGPDRWYRMYTIIYPHSTRWVPAMSRCKLRRCLSSLVAPDVVVTTTSGTTSDDKVGIVTTLNLWLYAILHRNLNHQTDLFVAPVDGIVCTQLYIPTAPGESRQCLAVSSAGVCHHWWHRMLS